MNIQLTFMKRITEKPWFKSIWEDTGLLKIPIPISWEGWVVWVIFWLLFFLGVSTITPQLSPSFRQNSPYFLIIIIGAFVFLFTVASLTGHLDEPPQTDNQNPKNPP